MALFSVELGGHLRATVGSLSRGASDDRSFRQVHRISTPLQRDIVLLRRQQNGQNQDQRAFLFGPLSRYHLSSPCLIVPAALGRQTVIAAASTGTRGGAFSSPTRDRDFVLKEIDLLVENIKWLHDRIHNEEQTSSSSSSGSPSRTSEGSNSSSGSSNDSSSNGSTSYTGNLRATAEMRARVGRLLDRVLLLQKFARQSNQRDARVPAQVTASLKALQREHSSLENIVRTALEFSVPAGLSARREAGSSSGSGGGGGGSGGSEGGRRGTREGPVGQQTLEIAFASDMGLPGGEERGEEEEEEGQGESEKEMLSVSYKMVTKAAEEDAIRADFRKEIEQRVRKQLTEQLSSSKPADLLTDPITSSASATSASTSANQTAQAQSTSTTSPLIPPSPSQPPSPPPPAAAGSQRFFPSSSLTANRVPPAAKSQMAPQLAGIIKSDEIKKIAGQQLGGRVEETQKKEEEEEEEEEEEKRAEGGLGSSGKSGGSEAQGVDEGKTREGEGEGGGKAGGGLAPAAATTADKQAARSSARATANRTNPLKVLWSSLAERLIGAMQAPGGEKEKERVEDKEEREEEREEKAQGRGRAEGEEVKEARGEMKERKGGQGGNGSADLKRDQKRGTLLMKNRSKVQSLAIAVAPSELPSKLPPSSSLSGFLSGGPGRDETSVSGDKASPSGSVEESPAGDVDVREGSAAAVGAGPTAVAVAEGAQSGAVEEWEAEVTKLQSEMWQMRSQLANLQEEQNERAEKAEARVKELEEELSSKVPKDVHEEMLRKLREPLSEARSRLTLLAAEIQQKDQLLSTVKRELEGERQRLIEKVQEMTEEVSKTVSVESMEAVVDAAIVNVQQELGRAHKRTKELMSDMEQRDSTLRVSREQWAKEREELLTALTEVKLQRQEAQKASLAELATSPAALGADGLAVGKVKNREEMMQQILYLEEFARKSQEAEVAATARMERVADLLGREISKLRREKRVLEARAQLSAWKLEALQMKLGEVRSDLISVRRALRDGHVALAMKQVEEMIKGAEKWEVEMPGGERGGPEDDDSEEEEEEEVGEKGEGDETIFGMDREETRKLMGRGKGEGDGASAGQSVVVREKESRGGSEQGGNGAARAAWWKESGPGEWKQFEVKEGDLLVEVGGERDGFGREEEESASPEVHVTSPSGDAGGEGEAEREAEGKLKEIEMVSEKEEEGEEVSLEVESFEEISEVDLDEDGSAETADVSEASGEDNREEREQSEEQLGEVGAEEAEEAEKTEGFEQEEEFGVVEGVEEEVGAAEAAVEPADPEEAFEDAAEEAAEVAEAAAVADADQTEEKQNAAEEEEVAPEPEPSGPTITVFYETGWESVFFHFNPENKGWSKVPGQAMSTSSEIGTNGQPLKVITIEAKALEFVVNNGASKWDSSPEGGNYKIFNPGQYVLSSGKVKEFQKK